MPNNVSPWGAQTTYDGDVRVFTGLDMPLLLHEVSHSMDWHAVPGHGDTFSSSSIWSDAYNRDLRTPSEYGRTNWMEDFAEAGKCGVADANLKGLKGRLRQRYVLVVHHSEPVQDVQAVLWLLYQAGRHLPQTLCQQPDGAYQRQQQAD